MSFETVSGSLQGQKRHILQERLFSDDRWGLAGLAGGVSHRRGSEIAGRLVAKAIVRSLENEQSLFRGFIAADKALKDVSNWNGSHPSARASAIAVRLHASGRLEVVWCGHFRAYVKRGDRLKAITRDHSFVQALLSAGGINHDEAREHPKRGVLTRALGGVTGADNAPERLVVRLQPGDQVLLVSNALSEVLSTQEMNATLDGATTLELRMKALLDCAAEQSPVDNVALVLSAYREDPR